jgi:type I restriction enzyme S subunit
MAGEWRDSTLGNVTDFLSGGTPSKSRADYWNGSIPWVSAKDMKQFRLQDTEDHVTELGASNGTRLAPAGSVLLLVRGMTLLNDLPICVVTKPMTFNQDVKALRPKANVIDDFVPYLLLGNKDRLLSRVDLAGHGTGRLNSDELKALEIGLPPKAEQRAIAHILGTLDDKIELNRRRNQTLEAMARALFKDWFVNFGPVRARIEARDPYLPADLWQLFPDRLDDEDKPEGWRRSTIGGEVTVCGGSTPSTKEPAFWEGGEHHWATPKDLSALTFPVLLDTDRKITDAAIAKISSGLLPVGTVLLSSRAPIGYLAIAEVPTAINQGFIAMKCNGALPNVFILFWCRENMDVILGNANGSTFQEVSKSNFRPIPVIVPPELILNAFRERTGPLYRHIVENERESKVLAQLRDTLLPKLISGELRIAEAERFLTRAETLNRVEITET